MNKQRGGKRPGAGRKKGLSSIKAEEARKYTIEKIAASLKPILSGQIELAKGLYYETTDESGQKRVYQTLPDSKVAAYLLNQLIGFPNKTAEIKLEHHTTLADLAQQAIERSREKEQTAV